MIKDSAAERWIVAGTMLIIVGLAVVYGSNFIQKASAATRRVING